MVPVIIYVDKLGLVNANNMHVKQFPNGLENTENGRIKSSARNT
jgi:hypothetical protein